jgi:HlyD family secretion protein
MTLRRKIIVIFLVLAVIGLTVLAFRPSPVSVTAVKVEHGSFQEYIEEEGKTRLRDSYTVSAPIGGWLQRVVLEPGDAVEAGETVFRLEPYPAPALDARAIEQARETLAAARARLSSAQALHETQQADARFADAEYERYRELHERGLVSSTEMDRARSQRDRAQASARAAAHSVEAARFEVAHAQSVLEIASGQRPETGQKPLEVRAPVAGLVLRRNRCCEGAVNAGDPILEIGNLDDLEVQVDLLSMDAVRIKPDMKVLIHGWGGDEILPATVRRVEPAGFTRISALGVEEQRVPVIVDFTDPREAWNALGEGYRIEARFILWEGDDVLQVPTSTLFRIDEGWAVFVIEDNRARLRPVQIGRRSGLITQVISGLEPGEKVVTHPGDRVSDGSRVTTGIRIYR